MWWKLTIALWLLGVLAVAALMALRAYRKRGEATCPCDRNGGVWPGGPCPYCGASDDQGSASPGL